MKCCHCSYNAFTTIDGIGLCSNCHTDFQNISNNNISSAYQLSRGTDVGESIFKAKNKLNQRQVTNQNTAVVNNYNTHNNITVNGNNSGSLHTGDTLIQSKNIGVANLSKSSNSSSGWLAKIMAKGPKIIKIFLKLKSFFN